MRYIQFPLDQGSPAPINAANDVQVDAEWLPSNVGQMAVEDDNFDPNQYQVDLTTVPFALIPAG